MLSNSELHLDVFGWDEKGRLKVIWSRLIQPGVNQKNKRLQIMPNPVQDIDSDNYLEIVASIYMIGRTKSIGTPRSLIHRLVSFAII